MFALFELALTVKNVDNIDYAAIGVPMYSLSFSSFLVAAMAAHMGIAWFLWSWFEGRGRSRTEILVTAAALFGVVWHYALIDGDGIRAREDFLRLRIILIFVFGGGLAFLVWALFCRELIRGRARRVCVALGILLALFINLNVHVSYRAFHGYLTTIACVLTAWLIAPAMVRKGVQKAVFSCVGLLFASALVFAQDRAHLEGHVRGLSHIVGPVLETLPISSRILLPTERLIDPEMALETKKREAIEARFEKASKRPVPPPAGKNVVVIVLESTRSDYWAEPKLTPVFHKWKRHGMYAPRGVAQYPATPLAYGAMFTGQYPSVLAQDPYWAKHRLFDEISAGFDRKILTRPKNRWFDYSSITAFFLSEKAKQNKHRNAVEALKYARKEIQKARSKNESFFSWIHLYEPHAPYTVRKEFPFGKSVNQRYRGEIAWLDSKMGGFMEWILGPGFKEDTLVLVLGDHGEGVGERVFGKRFVGHHVHVNTAVSHIPFFAAGPGFEPNTVHEDLRPAQIDVMPTVFEFLGVELPSKYRVQGLSMQSQLEKPVRRTLATEAFAIRGHKFFKFFSKAKDLTAEEMREAFADMNSDDSYAPKIGIELGSLKLVYDTWLMQGWVYDLSKDLRETKDIRESRPKDAKKMDEAFMDWRRTQAWVLDELGKLDLRHKEPVKK